MWATSISYDKSSNPIIISRCISGTAIRTFTAFFFWNTVSTCWHRSFTKRFNWTVLRSSNWYRFWRISAILLTRFRPSLSASMELQTQMLPRSSANKRYKKRFSKDFNSDVLRSAWVGYIPCCLQCCHEVCCIGIPDIFNGRLTVTLSPGSTALLAEPHFLQR